VILYRFFQFLRELNIGGTVDTDLVEMSWAFAILAECREFSALRHNNGARFISRASGFTHLAKAPLDPKEVFSGQSRILDLLLQVQQLIIFEFPELSLCSFSESASLIDKSGILVSIAPEMTELPILIFLQGVRHRL
jgi:hypothetical protein